MHAKGFRCKLHLHIRILHMGAILSEHREPACGSQHKSRSMFWYQLLLSSNIPLDQRLAKMYHKTHAIRIVLFHDLVQTWTFYSPQATSSTFAFPVWARDRPINENTNGELFRPCMQYKCVTFILKG